MDRKLLRVSLLLFGSGLCALVYQIAWLRELRLVFGVSTAASAAVLAIFMGGLGLGGAILGKVADRHESPLRLYGLLELLIAGCAVMTPFLILMGRYVYIFLGGVTVMGVFTATVMRILLSAVVLGIPTFLMGGTLPAAAKSVETDADVGRRNLAFLYGMNSLGAVAGATVATFFMLEVFGTRKMLWMACLLNALVGILARVMARQPKGKEIPPITDTETTIAGDIVPEQVADRLLHDGFVYAAALAVGFAFLLMELVWYRMLTPLLGGSTYTFGLILAVVLFGIGIGGGLYSMLDTSSRTTLRTLGFTCGLEALFIAVPYALGDRLAVLAALLRPLGAMGLEGHVVGWAFVTCIVALPPAIISGFQFPLLINLLGKGSKDVGKHTGNAYAWNTLGAILGSLAGGFGLLPLLTATGCWKAVVVLLVLFGLIATGFSAMLEGKRGDLVLPVFAIVVALGLIFAEGPTAAWRHSPIGAGRVDLTTMERNGIHNWVNSQQAAVVWETDGVESSVALKNSNSYSFYINGKSDGNARNDASTQVMSGMVSAILHPKPERVIVIGLGTGSTAGWLSEVETIKQVDVVEIEPDIIEVAKACAPVNQNVMSQPKVNIIIADAREVLLTSPDKYDLIISEPSNPYRAGIASMYTREFYEAVKERLSKNGIFSKWVQAYEVDSQTIRTIYATLATVFPVVETWQTNSADMIFVCSMEMIPYSMPDLQMRVAEEPFKSGLLAAWGVIDLEGFLSRFVAQAALAGAVAEEELKKGWFNTDDRMLIEFDFARTVGRSRRFSITDLRQTARTHGLDRPDLKSGMVDWNQVIENYFMMHSVYKHPLPNSINYSKEQRQRILAYTHFHNGNFEGVLEAWQKQPRKPQYPIELAMVAEALADAGDEAALPFIEKLRLYRPAEADAISGRLFWKKGKPGKAYKALESAFLRLREDPWSNLIIMEHALEVAAGVVESHPTLAKPFYKLLSLPFCVDMFHHMRLYLLLKIAAKIDAKHQATVVKKFEPDIPWNEWFLTYRHSCYKKTGDLMEQKAAADLEAFLRNASMPFNRTFSVK